MFLCVQMVKNAFCLVLIFFLAATLHVYAQVIPAPLTVSQTDSLRKVDSLRRMDSLARLDTVKLDTTRLNKYRLDSKRSPLPVIVRPVYIDQNLVPVSMLDYKVIYWRKWITMGFNLNQTAFSNNWAGGGISSLALGGNFDYKTEYNKAPFDYTGELLLLYGKSSNEGHLSRKTNDRIFLDNKIATQLSKSWYFFGSVSFESQMDRGYQYSDNAPPLLISKFMAPGYITESLGVEYKPNKVFDLRIGTGTARQTIVLDTTLYHHTSVNYGVTPGRTFKNELAFQVVSTFDKDIMQNMHLNARYALFIPYGRSLMNIDHRLDAVLAAKVNKMISVTINGTIVYDKDTSNKLQETEGLGIGVIYKFP